MYFGSATEIEGAAARERDDVARATQRLHVPTERCVRSFGRVGLGPLDLCCDARLVEHERHTLVRRSGHRWLWCAGSRRHSLRGRTQSARRRSRETSSSVPRRQRDMSEPGQYVARRSGVPLQWWCGTPEKTDRSTGECFRLRSVCHPTLETAPAYCLAKECYPGIVGAGAGLGGGTRPETAHPGVAASTPRLLPACLPRACDRWSRRWWTGAGQ